jgi:spore germination protein
MTKAMVPKLSVSVNVVIHNLLVYLGMKPFSALTTPRKTFLMGLSLIAAAGIVVSLKPRATSHDEAPKPKPYFSEEQSYLGRGNFINLDQATFVEPQSSELIPPTQVWTVAGSNTVSLNWTRLPNSKGYEVEYRTDNQAAQYARVEVPFFTVRNAASGKSYQFRVRTVAQDEQRSSYSAAVAVTPTALKQSTASEKIAFEVAGWVPPGWEDPDVRSSFDRGIGTLTEINPFWYNFSASGELEPKGGARNPEVTALAHQNGIKVIPTVTNNFDGDRVTAFLASPGKQDAFIQAVVQELRTYDYEGIDLDFENVHASDRNAFTVFLKTLAQQVHLSGKTIQLTAQAKKSDQDNWDGPGALDLDALADTFDRYKIMTYDFSRPDSEPGPIAPLSWLSEVLNYWKTKVPPEKILAGVPFYGYDWSLSTDDDVGIVWDGVQQIKDAFKVEEGVDVPSAEPFLKYADKDGPRIVYYQDAQSVARKIDVIKQAGVGGAAIWLLGSEDPANFNSIGSKTTVTTRVAEKPLNIGIKVTGQNVEVSVTKFPDIAKVKVLYGTDPERITEELDFSTNSIIELPPLAKGELRYIVAVAYDKSGREIRRSGIASVDTRTVDANNQEP